MVVLAPSLGEQQSRLQQPAGVNPLTAAIVGGPHLRWEPRVSSIVKPFSFGNREIPDLGAVDVELDDDFATALSRRATVRWIGHPPGGEPRLTVGSHALTPAPTLNVDLSVPHPMAMTPGELLAGGFGVIFAKVLADQLVREQTQASELVVQVAFVLSQSGPGSDPVLTQIRCSLEARAAGIDHARLAQIGEQAMRRSIDGLAMRADAIAVSLDVSLVGGPPKRPVKRPESTAVKATTVPLSSPAEHAAGSPANAPIG